MRKKWIQRQQELLNTAKAAGRELTADEQTEFDVVKVGPNQWMFDGMATLEFLKSALSLKIAPGRFSAATLNGIFCELQGSIPQQGDSVSFDHVTMYAHAVSGNRISRMLVTLESGDALGADIEGGSVV